jgi:hypothetical protein
MQQRRVAAGSGLSFLNNQKNAFLDVFGGKPTDLYKIGLGAFVTFFFEVFQDGFNPSKTNLYYLKKFLN